MDEQRTIVRESRPASAGGEIGRETYEEQTVRRSADGATVLGRIVVLVFGLIQLVIALRIVLLLVDADRANALVRGIYDMSAALIAPFDGILRIAQVSAGGSQLDVTAVVALVGWTLIELVILAAIRIGRRTA